MTVTTEEVAVKWPTLLEKIDEGEQITITRQGIPFANVTPASKSPKMTSAEAVDHLIALRKGVRLNGITIREMIDEGRKY